jgi:hypothetical protein
MVESRAAVAATAIGGWRVFWSDRGRVWASREKAFTYAEEYAGAYRTVDADDLGALLAQIVVQEEIAERARSAGGEG